MLLVLDLDLARTSRVELEHVLASLVLRGGEGTPDVAAIRNELASRVWQNVNPYGDPLAVPLGIGIQV